MEKEIISFDRNLASEIGINSAIVLNQLVDMHHHFVSIEELPLDDFFHCTTECLEQLTTMKYKAQTNAIKILIEYGFIKMVRREGNVKYFQIQFNKISEFCNNKTKVAYIDSEQKNTHFNLEKKHIKENFPKGKSIDNTELTNKQFSKEEDINNSYINNNIYINNTNKSSSLKPNTTSKSNTRELPEGENAVKEIVDNSGYMTMLTEFLKDKGFTIQMISLTIKEFVKKGINKFAVKDLKNAYDKMLAYEKNVRKVMYPPTFFANGVCMAIPEPPKPKKAVDEPQPIESVPTVWDWLDDQFNKENQTKSNLYSLNNNDDLFPYLQ